MQVLNKSIWLIFNQQFLTHGIHGKYRGAVSLLVNYSLQDGEGEWNGVVTKKISKINTIDLIAWRYLLMILVRRRSFFNMVTWTHFQHTKWTYSPIYPTNRAKMVAVSLPKNTIKTVTKWKQKKVKYFGTRHKNGGASKKKNCSKTIRLFFHSIV